MLTREFYALAPGGAVASNVVANIKLYLSTLVTLHAAFLTVRPGANRTNTANCGCYISAKADRRKQRALAVQSEYHFRYPLPALIGKRVTDLYSKGADVLADDFAPADLYRVAPLTQALTRRCMV
jgi:hypothetical protein